MEKKTVSRIMLTVLLIGTLNVMSSTLPVASGLVNDGTEGAPDQQPDVYKPSINSSGSSIRLGVWLPRYAGDLPPYTDLNSAGIQAIDVTVLDETTLPNLDVVYIGRGGFYVHTGEGMIDPQAIKDWVSSGGGILGESEAVIYDSVGTLGNQWSPQLSEIFGVWSTQADSGDYYVGDEDTIITITDPTHPITTGLPESFSTRVYSAEFYAYVDVGRNPTAKKIFDVTTGAGWGSGPFIIPVIAAEYGCGKAVYFPYCPDGYTDWASPGGQNLQMLFINAVKWAAPPPPLSASMSPLSASILVGQSVTFTSTVSGGYTPYSYQWYFNGNPVSGANANSWTFTPTTSGIYYIHLKVTDAKENTAQSDTARITAATVPVGGYSVPIQLHTKTEPIIPYIALIATLTAIFTKLRPKIKRKH